MNRIPKLIIFTSSVSEDICMQFNAFFADKCLGNIIKYDFHYIDGVYRLVVLYAELIKNEDHN